MLEVGASIYIFIYFCKKTIMSDTWLVERGDGEILGRVRMRSENSRERKRKMREKDERGERDR